ncbi:glutamate--tRNA ligase [Paraliomyxa miuraensis]|uniref:glutamate--tRNA ligase n=1 Tax=Paraliomyxa miuraensis TaxID=376150 RepID=UPI002258A1EE|nr:glutamate--tRNA ligase [Paraliomyxa miuraensis]MCX4243230.1 glutamate--tRNA ligase [Paraliomyxa miuraensis]
MPTPGRMPPRVRIAPSPTGDPHVGTAYVALFNYAFARRHGGKFVLRIEDTDQERYTPGSEQAILEALRWLGLSWDEGPDVGGEHGPYRQSERLPIYREHLTTLLDSGRAYRCFCTRERLDELRRAQMAAKASFLGYDGHCRDLDPGEAQQRAEAGQPHVVRLRVPKGGRTVVADRLHGDVEFSHSEIDDQVLLKSDGFPTYHLANVVDDHLMGITHVIRGEEWMSSTPKHVLLYDAFGWEEPQWYHLGLLRNYDKSKLSKRKNPVSIIHYRELGFLPSTLLNFLATLGFSMGDDRERFSLQEMVDAFEWSKVSPGGPVFDPRKLEAFNADDIRALSPEALYEHVMTQVLRPDRLRTMLALAHERLIRLDDFIPYVSFFFGASLDYTPVVDKLHVKGRTFKQSAKLLHEYIELIERDPEARAFTPEALENFSRSFCERNDWKPRDLFTLLRIGISGRTAAPPLFDTMALCGKDRVRMRLRDLIALLKALPEAK